MAKESGAGPLEGKGTGSTVNDNGVQASGPDKPGDSALESQIKASFGEFTSNPTQGYNPQSVTE